MSRIGSENIPDAIRGALLAGLWVGAVDLLASTVVGGRGGASALFIAGGLAVTALLASLLFLAAVPISLAIQRLAGLGADAVRTALYYSAAVLVALIHLSDGFPLHAIASRFPSTARLAGLVFLWAAVVVLVAFAAYRLHESVSARPRWRRALSGWHIAGPFVILGLVAWLLLASSARYAPMLSSGAFSLAFAALAAVAIALAAFVARYRVGRLLIAAAILALMLGPWPLIWLAERQPTAEGEAEPKKPRYVVLIVVDTLRADALTCYNPAASPTPNIDALAADGVLFENANTVSSWTLPSMASMLTGLSPFAHGSIHKSSKVPAQIPTVATYLQGEGYRTAGIGMNSVLGPHVGLARGFDEYWWYPRRVLDHSIGGDLLQSASKRRFGVRVLTEDLGAFSEGWLQENYETPFFLWFHVYDPHMPYDPPELYRTEEIDPLPGGAVGFSMEHYHNVRRGALILSGAQKETVKKLYSGEVRYVDDEVGEVIEKLRTLGIYDDSLIIFTSDHGEELWDRNGIGHGHSLHREVMRVPLIIKLPGAEVKKVVHGRTTTMNITPTILDYVEVTPDPRGMNGRSLRPILEDPNPVAEGEAVFATGLIYYDQQEAAIIDEAKYVRTLSGALPDTLYDLGHDPTERESVAVTQPDQLARIRSALDTYIAEAKALGAAYGLKAKGGKESQELTPEQLEAMEAVGYL